MVGRRRVVGRRRLLAMGVLATLAAGPALACPDRSDVPGWHVANGGDDNADGSVERPFASIERARQAMRDGPYHVSYVDSGLYAPAETIRLGPEDAFATLAGCTAEPPTLDAGPAGLQTLLDLRQTTGVRVSGFTFKHATGAAVVSRDSSYLRVVHNRFEDNEEGVLLDGTTRSLVCGNTIVRSAASAVEVKDGSDDNVFAHNAIDRTGAPHTSGGGFFLHGASRSLITRNLVENTNGMGIGVADWGPGTINIGTVIEGNVVRRANRTGEDSGAIYLLGRSHAETGALVLHNLIEETGAPGDAHTIGIYLDDSTSAVRVERNIVRGIGTHGVQIHGGDDILVQNNLFELPPAATSAVLFQAAPADTNPTNTMRNNRVSGNVILMRGPARPAYTFIEGGAPAIGGNLVSITSGARQPESPAGDVMVVAPGSGDDDIALSTLAAALIGFEPISLEGIGPDPRAGCNEDVASR